MDLFGRKKTLATKVTLEFLRPLFGIFQHFNGVPPRFWQDEFVVGFVGGSMGFLQRNIDLSTEDKGLVMLEIFSQLSHINGASITRHFTALAENPTRDFNLGADAVYLIMGYSAGRLKNEMGFPNVVKATEVARAQGQGNDRNIILGHLTKFEFYDVLEERFKE